MTSKEIKNKIEILRKELNDANKEYYIEESSSLSDFEYDKKFTELIELEKNHSALIIPESTNPKSWIKSSFRIPSGYTFNSYA